MLVLLSLSGYAFVAIKKPLPPLSYTLEVPKISKNDPVLAWPTTGQASVGSLNEGLLASSVTAPTPQPIASVAKVITALAVLKQKPIGADRAVPILTMTEQDVASYAYYRDNNGSNVPVEAGEEITEYQALEALMLPSANNMADTLAIWAFGSIDEYLTYANAMLKEYGVSQTTVADASGFSPGTVSTANDLVTIGQKALQNEIIKTIASETTAVIPVAGTIRNVNTLLGTQNIIGIKTGNTDEAGGCLLFAATYALTPEHSVTIVGAVVGNASLGDAFLATQTLLLSTMKGFSETTIIKKGGTLGQATSVWGQTSTLVAEKNLITYGWSGKAVSLKTTSETPTTNLRANQKVGVITAATYDGMAVSEIQAKSIVKEPTLWWRLSHYF